MDYWVNYYYDTFLKINCIIVNCYSVIVFKFSKLAESCFLRVWVEYDFSLKFRHNFRRGPIGFKFVLESLRNLHPFFSLHLIRGLHPFFFRPIQENAPFIFLHLIPVWW